MDKTSSGNGNGHKHANGNGNGNRNAPHAEHEPKRVKRNAIDRRRVPPLEARLGNLLQVIQCMVDGEFHVRMPVVDDGTLIDRIAHSVNELNSRHEQMTDEIVRVERVVGREGRMNERARLDETPTAAGRPESIRSTAHRRPGAADDGDRARPQRRRRAAI